MVSERFEMRWDEDVLERIDAWRSDEEGAPSRAEAIRRLVEAGLRVKSKEAVQFSDGEKLIVLMLSDLMKQAKVRGDTNVDFVKRVIFGGHYWALKWNMDGVFHKYADRPQVVKDVVNILDMWTFIEQAYAKLSKKDKDRIEAEVPHIGKYVSFKGFDGNNESEHMGVARFMIEDVGRFTNFKGRPLNSHMPLLQRYRNMYYTFEPIRKTLGIGGTNLGADEIIKLLQAR